MSKKSLDLSEANKMIKEEGEIFKKLAKLFGDLNNVEEKTKNTKTRCFQSFENITEEDNKTLKELYETFGNKMKKSEESRGRHLEFIKEYIVPVLQNYPTELKKNQDKLEEVSKAQKNTENLRKSQAPQEDITRSVNEMNQKVRTFEDAFINFEKKRANDNKHIFAKYIHSELKYHCEAIELLSKLFSDIKKTELNADLEEFAEKYGIKNYNFDNLGINMKEVKEKKEKREAEQKEKKDDVYSQKEENKSENGSQKENNKNNNDEDNKADSNEDDDDDEDKNNKSKSMDKSKFSKRGFGNKLNKSKHNNKMSQLSNVSESRNINEEDD